MMAVEMTDIQVDLLSGLVHKQEVVWVFLMNGIKLTGQLLAFDKYSLALQSPNGMQTVMKIAVSAVCESYSVQSGRSPERGSRLHSRRGFGGKKIN